jgi:Fic family protein
MALSNNDHFILGQCDSLIKSVLNTPIDPIYYQEIKAVALIKGIQATTAIEGNTLSEDEIKRAIKGEKLPQSKEYQEIEVTNILRAFNDLVKSVVSGDRDKLITPDLLLDFHRMVGAGLGAHFEAVPGQFRTGSNNVVVGKYRGAEGVDVEPLIQSFCDFLREQFRFESGGHTFMDVIIEAIVAHVYIELIHPFGDGNGRTGRLIEFYILLRGGLPDITLHILSNHYNLTRPDYYRQLQRTSETKDLTGFITYAIVGLRDGLVEVLKKIQLSQTQITWIKYIYDVFDHMALGKEDTFKRKRTLALEMPLYRQVSLNEIPDLSIKLAKIYGQASTKTIYRDAEEMVGVGIFIKNNYKYEANISKLNEMFARNKSSIK